MKLLIVGLIFLLMISTNVNISSQPDPELKILVVRRPDHDQLLLKGHLMDSYTTYGSVALKFDFRTADRHEITLELLENISADVIYLANLHSGLNLLSDSEIQAIKAYSLQGHSLIGEHQTLEPYTHGNLGPLFGLDGEEISATGGGLPNSEFNQEFALRNKYHPIFFNLGDTYITSSSTTLAPTGTSNSWISSPYLLLENSTVHSTSTDGKAAIISTESGFFRSLYLTFYPSFNPNYQDLQFLYNAFAWAGFLEEELRLPSSSSLDTSTPRVGLVHFPSISLTIILSVITLKISKPK